MTYCFYICICLCLIIFQTAAMPHLPLFDNFYNLLCPFVVYLGLFRPAREGIPTILFLGFVMDSLSAAPFGLYVTTYFWLFAGIKWITSFLQVSSSPLFPSVALGVLIENLIFIGTVAMLIPDLQPPADAVRTVTAQVLWAICTGPFFLLFFKYTHERIKSFGNSTT